MGVNLRHLPIVGEVSNPDSLLVGARFARDIACTVASEARSYRVSDVPNANAHLTLI